MFGLGVELATIAIMTVVMVIAMIFVVPMAFMHLPATLIMVVVRMAPVSSGIRRPLPNSWNPDIPSPANAPVAINPGVAFARKRRPYLITNGWRRRTDVNLHLAECWNC
jgi:hypothetical protein